MTEKFGNAGIIIPPGSITPDKLGYTAARLFVYMGSTFGLSPSDDTIDFDTIAYPGFRTDASEYNIGPTPPPDGIFTPAEAGYYYIKASVGSAEGLNAILEIRIKTSEDTPGDRIIGYAAAHGRAGEPTGGLLTASAAALVYLNPGATPTQDIRVSASSTVSAGGLEGPQYTNLQIFRVL